MTDHSADVLPFRIRRRQCDHNHCELDESLELVKCTDCGERVSPFWLLSRMVASQTRAQMQLEVTKEKLEKARNKLSSPILCKHCGKICR